MELKDAIEKAGRSEDIKSLKDYFLCSCFAYLKGVKDKISEWTLLYYSPKSRMVIDCFVGDEVIVGEETPPISEVEKPDFSEVTVTAEDALETASKNFSKGTINVMITLHSKGTAVWTISMITADMMVTIFDIDAKTGKIIKEEATSLVRRP